MSDTLTIRLDKDLADALTEAARQTGLTKGEIAREALHAKLGEKSKLRVLSRHFGSVQGPKDLSANKAYRRGWKPPRA